MEPALVGSRFSFYFQFHMAQILNKFVVFGFGIGINVDLTFVYNTVEVARLDVACLPR